MEQETSSFAGMLISTAVPIKITSSTSQSMQITSDDFEEGIVLFFLRSSGIHVKVGSVVRSSSEAPSSFLVLTSDSSSIIRKMIEEYLTNNPDCSIIIIDGLLDLIVNMNDEREASLVTKWLKKITKVYNVLLITVLHQSKSNLSTTGHIGSASDRFAQSTLDIVKEKEKNCYVLSSRFMRSDADFEPITLMNFNGVFQQVETEVKKDAGKKASDLTDLESKALCNKIIVVPTNYNDISDEIIERTATSKAYAKNLIKIWINKGYILKGADNKYFTR